MSGPGFDGEPSPRPDGRGIGAVVFDMDGTLLDSMTTAPRAYADAIRSLGGPDVAPGEVVAVWNLGPTAAVLAHFLGRAATPEDVDRYFAQLGTAATAVQPFPGVARMLGELSREGRRLGVFTGASHRSATLLLAASGLDRWFAAVVGGDEVSEPKPAPVGLHLACQRLGMRAVEAAYVGDSPVDLECARAAGALGIHAAWGAPVTTGHDLVARHPGELAGLLDGRREPRGR